MARDRARPTRSSTMSTVGKLAEFSLMLCLCYQQLACIIRRRQRLDGEETGQTSAITRDKGLKTATTWPASGSFGNLVESFGCPVRPSDRQPRSTRCRYPRQKRQDVESRRNHPCADRRSARQRHGHHRFRVRGGPARARRPTPGQLVPHLLRPFRIERSAADLKRTRDDRADVIARSATIATTPNQSRGDGRAACRIARK